MRRATIVSLAGLLIACGSTRQSCPKDARYSNVDDDTSLGIPSTVSPVLDTAGLLTIPITGRRQCQVLIEPFFHTPHAVWLQVEDGGDATVVVKVLTREPPAERYAVALDRRTASLLDELCQSFLQYRPRCERRGYDGVYYHVAHREPGGAYTMRSFWSPARGSVDDHFVQVITTLRNFATSPASLRSAHWGRIHDLAGQLPDELQPTSAESD